MSHEGLKVATLLFLLLVALDDLPHELSQADRGVVATRQHQSIQQVLDIEQVASCQICRGAWGFRDLVRHSVEAVLEVHFVFLADEDGEVAGHDLAQGGYLYLFGLVEGSNGLILLHIVDVEDPSAEDLRVVL